MASDSSPGMIAPDAFEKLSVNGMKQVLKEMHESGEYGKVKRTGNKAALIDEFKRARGDATVGVSSTTGTAPAPTSANAQGTTDSAPATTAAKTKKAKAKESDPVAQAEARSVLTNLMLAPAKTSISAGTRSILEKMNTPQWRKYHLRDECDDLSAELKEAIDVVGFLHSTISGMQDLSPDYSVNYEHAFHELHATYGEVTLHNPLLHRFYLSLGLDVAVSKPAEVQAAMAASMPVPTGQLDVGAEVEKELAVLRNALDIALRQWTTQFPEANVDDAAWPTDFTPAEKKAIRTWMTQQLDVLDAEMDIDAWDRTMSDDVLTGLVEKLAGLPSYPLQNGKGFNETTLRAMVRTVLGERDRSRSRSKSRSMSRGTSLAPSEMQGLSGSEEEEQPSGAGEGTVGRTKRKRPLVESDEDEDEDNLAMNIAKQGKMVGGDGHGRGAGVRAAQLPTGRVPESSDAEGAESAETDFEGCSD
ncbi:hypothetical protein NX059_001945 [Plenodomus lindquistii]|nr:hypothetical protein NX059_001945 [Plenodomus lindquistii]